MKFPIDKSFTSFLHQTSFMVYFITYIKKYNMKSPFLTTMCLQSLTLASHLSFFLRCIVLDSLFTLLKGMGT